MKDLIQINAVSAKKATMKMYGTVSQWSDLRASTVNTELAKLSKSYEEIDIHLHSPGGSVFEGIAIRAAMQDSPAKINVVVDGVAASMGSVLMISGETAKAAKNARIMIHQANGGAYGSANKLRDTASLMESINNEMADIYAEKTGKDKQWILDNWMKEGQDKWFTAKEALQAGLIDEIVQSKTREKVAAETFEEIAACFDEALLDEDTEIVNIEHQNKSEMKLVAKFLGLSEDATEQQIIDAMQKRDDDAAKAAANLFVAMGEKSGQINAENKSKFEKLAQTDLSLAVDFLPSAEAPKAKSEKKEDEKEDVKTDQHASLLDAIKSLQKGSSESDTRAGWDWTRWSKEDPKGLEAMANQDPENAAKLLNKSYGLNVKATQISNYL